jgi:hypothetical protein
MGEESCGKNPSNSLTAGFSCSASLAKSVMRSKRHQRWKNYARELLSVYRPSPKGASWPLCNLKLPKYRGYMHTDTVATIIFSEFKQL